MSIILSVISDAGTFRILDNSMDEGLEPNFQEARIRFFPNDL